jgi:hypothetical protein
MSFSRSGFAFAFALTAFCFDGPTAHAQSNAVSFWTLGWQTGFAGNPTAVQSSNPYGDLLAFSGSAAAGSKFSSRFNFENGWFVDTERGGLGLGINGLSQAGTWGNISSLTYGGTQFGYNFKNAPLTVYAGFNTLNFNTPNLAGFESTSSTNPGYGFHGAIEFRPTSNLSLSLGVGYTQLPAGYNGGINP